MFSSFVYLGQEMAIIDDRNKQMRILRYFGIGEYHDDHGVLVAPELLLLCPKEHRDFRPRQWEGEDESLYCGPATLMTTLRKHDTRPNLWVGQLAIPDPNQESPILVNVGLFGPYPKLIPGWEDLYKGADALFCGVVRRFGREWYLTQVQRIQPHEYGEVIPVYRSVKGMFRGAEMLPWIRYILEQKGTVQEAARILHRRLGQHSIGIERLMNLIEALHRPGSAELGEAAIESAKKLSLRAIVHRAQEPKRVVLPRSVIAIEARYVERLKARLPFALTASQHEAIGRIVEALKSETPLRGLLSGDVGSGKTIVYGLTAVAAWHAGARVAILTPNLPLAKQVYRELTQFFPDAPVHLVTGESVDAHLKGIVVGTTALVHRAKKHEWYADYLIVDEQQKFSLAQRLAVALPETNILEATATCIPRTFGQACYGGMEVMRIYAHAKKNISSFIVGDQEKRVLLEEVQAALGRGEGVAIIYPELRTDEEDIRRNVMAAWRYWQQRYPDLTALLHGDMKDAEKDAVLEAMRTGKAKLLVTTSIIEVGITIPNLRLLIVVSADRYGTSTLHQMRGRLAREGGSGRFIMHVPFPTDTLDGLPKPKQETLERLEQLVQTNDGFELAERDARTRGFGDLLSDEDRQTGKTGSVFHGLMLEPQDFTEYLERRQGQTVRFAERTH